MPPHLLSAVLRSVGACRWLVTRPLVSLARATKYFAPANLRATTEDDSYRRLIDYYMRNKYTLRYSGGLVPDFYHALIKGQGVFLSPVTAHSPAKLRLVYEVAALAFISCAAGGGAVDQHGHDLMTHTVSTTNHADMLLKGPHCQQHQGSRCAQELTVLLHCVFCTSLLVFVSCVCQLSSYDARSGLVIGSLSEIERYKEFRSGASEQQPPASNA